MTDVSADEKSRFEDDDDIRGSLTRLRQDRNDNKAQEESVRVSWIKSSQREAQSESKV